MKRMMNKKKVSAIVLATCVAVLCVWIFSTPDVGKKVTYTTAVVERNEVTTMVTATGTIEPVTEVEVGTQVSGIIDKLYADYNSEVKKGQVIAEMDRITLSSELSSRQAAFDGAKAEYVYQQKNYERMTTLSQKHLVSDTDLEQALYAYQKAKSTFDSSKADLVKAQRNLSYTTITSPIDGIVIARSVEEGQTVAAGFSTPTLFTIAADLTQMQVVAKVDEADIGGVENGQRVTFTVDAYPGDTFEGVVSQVRLGDASTSSTTSSSTVVNYEVVITAPNPDVKLKPRLTANVSIYVQDRKGVLCVPAKALRFTPEPMLVGKKAVVKDCTAKYKVWTREGDTFTAHSVEVGITNGINTEIISGVTEGMNVITEAVVNVPGTESFVGSQTESGQEKSPFMPSRPGEKKGK